MRLDDLNAQLAARFLIQKADSLDRILPGVANVGAEAARWFREDLLPTVRWAKDKEPGQVAHRVAQGLGSFWTRVDRVMERVLAEQLAWTWEDGYQALVDVLPRAYWLHLAAARGLEIREDVDYSGAGSIAAAKGLFQPMERKTVRGIMFAPPEQARDGLNWRERIEGYSRLTTEPATIADHLSAGLRAGRNPNDVAEKLLPWVQKNQAAATRIARTEMLRVSQEGLREQWGAFDDVIAGFKILSSLDDLTRPHHRTRHGDLYLKPDEDGRLPEGAKGTPDQRPIVPDEPNCRCYESPVLLELPGVFQDVVRKDRTMASMDGPVEDPVLASRWFDDQSTARKKRILGPGRYRVLSGNLERAGAGPNVTWADAVNPQDGKLSLVRNIKGEPVQATLTRRGVNERAFLKREALLTQDRPEMFPGMKLTGKGGRPPPPPLPPVDPGPPAPPGKPPHGLTTGQVEALDRWQNEGHVWTRDYYTESGYTDWRHAVTKRDVSVQVTRKVDAGLRKLPLVTTKAGNAKTVYRGLQAVSDADLNRLLQSKVIEWDNYQAASLSRTVARDFANGPPGTNNVVFRMKSTSGRDLRALGGRAAREQTVLFERGRRWKVGKVYIRDRPDGGKWHEILLEETTPAKDSPLFTKATAPRKRLWSVVPPIPPAPAPTTRPKPSFSEVPAEAIRLAREEMAREGLTQRALQGGWVEMARESVEGHEAFWRVLRKLNGTAEVTTGVRGGIMAQRKKILAAFDRRLKKLEKDLAARKAAGTHWEPFARRIRRVEQKRKAQELWFQTFAEVADESLVQDPLLGEVTWKIGRKKRAAAYRWENEIRTWRVAEENVETWAHEFGHHVEYRNPRVQQRLVRWRTERAAGAPQKSVYPWSPGSSERGYPDGWYKGYTGRVYPRRDSTEILSMACQFTTTHSELASAAASDFDHVAMLWAILRGY